MSDTPTPREELEIRTCFMGTKLWEIEAVPLFRYRTLERELAALSKEMRRERHEAHVNKARVNKLQKKLVRAVEDKVHYLETSGARITELQRELTEAREIAEMQKETMRQMREKYGFGERNVMRELRQEIENLNKIIAAATNSANASHFRAIEYQSQRDTLVDAAQAVVNRWDAPTWKELESTAKLISALRKAIAAVKGGDA
jgi:septal ring factor EnvC (AmiA/AmiB activator)